MSNIANILIDALKDRLTPSDQVELKVGFSDLENASQETIVRRTVQVMGSLELGDQEGITVTSPVGYRTFRVEPVGNLFLGSNIDDPGTTSMAALSQPMKYNGESLGAGDVLLGDNSSGRANLLWDASAGKLLFRGGTTEGIVLDIDGTITIGTTDPKIILDGVNKVIKSSNYAANAAGFQLSAVDGDAEFNNITARGTFRTAVFQKENISAVGGGILIATNAGEIYEDVSIPANGQSVNLKIKNDDEGNAIAQATEILRIKAWNGTVIVDVWATVSSVSGTTPYRTYNCVVGSGGNVSVQKGMAVVNYGTSGAGLLHLEAGLYPRLIVAYHGSTPWTGINNRVVLGDMYGNYGTGTNHRFGIGIGDYSAGNYLSYNAQVANEFILKAGGGALSINANGIRIWDLGTSTSRITWQYDSGGATKIIGSVFGDYDSGTTTAVMWQTAYRQSGDPWNTIVATVGAIDYVASKSAQIYTWGSGKILLDADTNIDIDATTLVRLTQAGLYIGSLGSPASVSDGELKTTRNATFGYGDTNEQVNINGAAGTVRDLVFNTNGSPRWIFRIDSTAESGSNAGSNIQIMGRDDSGGNLGTYLQFNRASGDIYTVAWQDYSGSSTVTGWSSFTTKYIYFKKIGKRVWVEFYIDGTSNNTATSFTLPYPRAALPANMAFYYRDRDNGAWQTSPMGYLYASSTLVNLYTTQGGGSHTASGQKTCIGSFSYEAA